MPTLVIPGVAVTVVKEVLPQQLSPSGVLGIIGLVEKPSATTLRASSWSRFVDLFGAASAYSMPEAKQAFDNGVSELVVVSIEGTSKRASVAVGANDGTPKGTAGFTLEARAAGAWANTIQAKIEVRADGFDIAVYFGDPTAAGAKPVEVLRSLTPSKIMTDGLPSTYLRTSGTALTATSWPKAGTYALANGCDAATSDYSGALDKLKEESDVDMVLAAVQDFSNSDNVAKLYGEVINHCTAQSAECKGRIGFGQVPKNDVAAAKSFVNSLASDRFVLVAPTGVVGAMAGMVGNLDYWQSPTFKSVSGVGVLSPIVTEDQKTLLGVNIVPVVLQRGRGLIALRGLTTDGDQINVRRVADYAVRTMKQIGDLFIGLLNNADGRSALKQKLTEALMQMVKDGAIVPSTDGKDPAFKVDVYSSQDDFAKGIVRVNMAVRPVRAIDYIYATITVQI